MTSFFEFGSLFQFSSTGHNSSQQGPEGTQISFESGADGLAPVPQDSKPGTLGSNRYDIHIGIGAVRGTNGEGILVVTTLGNAIRFEG